MRHIQDDISRYQITESYEDYYAEIIHLYYNWVRQYQSMILAQSAFNETQKALTSVKNRQLKKIANQTDVCKLQLQLLTKKEALIKIEQDFFETSNQIKQAMNVTENTIEFKPDTTIIADALPNKATILDEFYNSRSYKLLELFKSQEDVELEQAILATMVDLNLLASITYTTETVATLGFSWEQYVANKSNRAEKETQALDVKKVNLETMHQESLLVYQLKNIVTQLHYLDERINIAKEKVTLAQFIYKNESENYRLGKIDLNDFIDAVNRKDSTQFDYIDQLITYQQISTEYRRLTDQLIIKLPQ